MLAKILEEYLAVFPKDRKGLTLLFKQLDANEILDGKTNYTGHVTGTAIILSPDFRRMLVVFHPTMRRWQPPGGHWDEDEEGPWITAEREALEETGVKIARRINLVNDIRIPLQIDSHIVPRKPPKNEPEHYHHDFRYGFVAESEDLKLDDEVIKEAKWQSLDELKLENAREAFLRLQRQIKLKA